MKKILFLFFYFLWKLFNENNLVELKSFVSLFNSLVIVIGYIE